MYQGNISTKLYKINLFLERVSLVIRPDYNSVSTAAEKCCAEKFCIVRRIFLLRCN